MDAEWDGAFTEIAEKLDLSPTDVMAVIVLPNSSVAVLYTIGIENTADLGSADVFALMLEHEDGSLRPVGEAQQRGTINDLMRWFPSP